MQQQYELEGEIKAYTLEKDNIKHYYVKITTNSLIRTFKELKIPFSRAPLYTV